MPYWDFIDMVFRLFHYYSRLQSCRCLDMKNFTQSCQCFHDWVLNSFSRELIRKPSLLDLSEKSRSCQIYFCWNMRMYNKEHHIKLASVFWNAVCLCFKGFKDLLKSGIQVKDVFMYCSELGHYWMSDILFPKQQIWPSLARTVF